MIEELHLYKNKYKIKIDGGGMISLEMRDLDVGGLVTLQIQE